jgi:hypothetical protein
MEAGSSPPDGREGGRAAGRRRRLTLVHEVGIGPEIRSGVAATTENLFTADTLAIRCLHRNPGRVELGQRGFETFLRLQVLPVDVA